MIQRRNINYSQVVFNPGVRDKLIERGLIR